MICKITFQDADGATTVVADVQIIYADGSVQESSWKSKSWDEALQSVPMLLMKMTDELVSNYNYKRDTIP